MIHRNCREGLKLDVVGLNEITVLIDRAETQLTEVAINTWHRDLDGPPHYHNQKEQVFLVTSGHGSVQLGSDKYPAERGALFYVPAGLIHQTVTHGDEPLQYFLFNAFSDSSKEGHASFADHIEKVKETRRQQAQQQRATTDADKPPIALSHTSKAVPSQPASTSFSVDVRLARYETRRCEVISLFLPSNHEAHHLTDATKEQTLLISSGNGTVTVGGETCVLCPGDVIFVPCGIPATMQAGSEGINAVSFGTVINA